MSKNKIWLRVNHVFACYVNYIERKLHNNFLSFQYSLTTFVLMFNNVCVTTLKFFISINDVLISFFNNECYVKLYDYYNVIFSTITHHEKRFQRMIFSIITFYAFSTIDFFSQCTSCETFSMNAHYDTTCEFVTFSTMNIEDQKIEKNRKKWVIDEVENEIEKWVKFKSFDRKLINSSRLNKFFQISTLFFRN